MYHPPVLFPFGASLPTRPDWRLARIQQILADQAGDTTLTLTHFAGKLGISSKRLSQLFVEITGQRFRSFALLQRLHRASHLLQETTQPVKQIAAELGYRHTGDFCARFKIVFGVTPKDYRQRARADRAFGPLPPPSYTSPRRKS